MKQKLLVIGLPLALALAAATADATPRFFPHSAVQCNQADHNAANIIDRTQFGVNNTSFVDGVTVECPVNISFPSPQNHLLTAFSIRAYDRNPSADIDCFLQRLDGNGNITYSANLHTSGSSATVQDMTIFPSSVLVEDPWRLRCWIPPTVTPNNFNHIVHYELQSDAS